MNEKDDDDDNMIMTKQRTRSYRFRVKQQPSKHCVDRPAQLRAVQRQRSIQTRAAAPAGSPVLDRSRHHAPPVPATRPYLFVVSLFLLLRPSSETTFPPVVQDTRPAAGRTTGRPAMGLRQRALSCPMVPASPLHRRLAYFTALLDGVAMAILLVVRTYVCAPSDGVQFDTAAAAVAGRRGHGVRRRAWRGAGRSVHRTHTHGPRPPAVHARCVAAVLRGCGTRAMLRARDAAAALSACALVWVAFRCSQCMPGYVLRGSRPFLSVLACLLLVCLFVCFGPPSGWFPRQAPRRHSPRALIWPGRASICCVRVCVHVAPDGPSAPAAACSGWLIARARRVGQLGGLRRAHMVMEGGRNGRPAGGLCCSVRAPRHMQRAKPGQHLDPPRWISSLPLLPMSHTEREREEKKKKKNKERESVCVCEMISIGAKHE